ncbi:MAG TPA: sigma-70 family RNA polymerase sigma factor [Pirellulales bacterium]
MRLTPDEVRDLRRRAIDGDAGARERLTLSCLRYAVKLAWQFHYASGTDVDECVSEATFAAVRCVDSFDPDQASLLHYLHVCVRNALTAVSRKRTLPTVAFNDPDVERSSENWERERERADDIEAVAGAVRASIDALPPRLKQIAAWGYLDELTGTEIARRLGVSRERVRQLLNKADALLRESLRGHASTPPFAASDNAVPRRLRRRPPSRSRGLRVYSDRGGTSLTDDEPTGSADIRLVAQREPHRSVRVA